ncbi:TPA: hypothetical protein VKO32_000609 [Streptococcus pyogenes NGAS346]|nr:hypothetical protein [Streptococcus pyogenes]HER4676249.1 hypothetical protein [Streptococcus pyogenes NGAS346]HER4710137.1 hypothetical protein [Streptococcus pyogenes NGAS330]
MTKRPNIQVPGDIQLANDTDYRDGYEEGFGEGQHKRYPLETEAEGDSQEHEGRETPEDSQRSEERQEELDNQQGDMLTQLLTAIVEAWDYVLSWFKL